MNLTDEEMLRLKACEVSMLKEFIEICEKLGLRYYALYGTLLGAVRHQGFIPWDDDIDVGMMREDYEVFVREGQKYLSEHLFLQTYESDPEYISGYAKIRDNNTTFIETSVKSRKMNHGIFIDIFPLDSFSDKNLYWFQLRCRVLAERVRMETIPTKLVPLRGKLVRPFAKLLYPTTDDICRKRDKMLKARKGPLIASHFGENEYLPSEWYAEGTTLSFEGLQILAPKEYDRVLCAIYGDYMQLPPVEQRVSVHDTVKIDTEKSYLNYINRI